MAHLNVEFKANTNSIDSLEEKLQALQPRYIGTDHQMDTYFNTPTGRLKLREGNVENALIYYERINTNAAKESKVILFQQPDKNLKEILVKTNGIKVVVDKTRKIYFVDNVKIHFDVVNGLGQFVEVEAIDYAGDMSIEKLQSQFDYFANYFDIAPTDYIAYSYSDLLLEQSV